MVIYKPGEFGEAPHGELHGRHRRRRRVQRLHADGLRGRRDPGRGGDRGARRGRAVDPSKITFGCGPARPDRYWCPTSRKVRSQPECRYAGPDYVGVWMRIEHPSVTKIFAGVTIEDHSVIRLEPRSE